MSRPMYITIAGERYKATALRIEGWTDDDRPRELLLLQDGERVDTTGNPHFLIAYFSTHGLAPHKGRD